MKTLLRAFLFAALLLHLQTILLKAQTPVEIWITPTGSGGGTGTASDPFSVVNGDPINTPTANSFFDLIHGQRLVNGVPFVIPPNSTIHLMPGTFLVQEGTTLSGHTRFCLTPKNGWKIKGAGMDVTILKVINNHPAALFGGKLGVIQGNGDWTDASQIPVDGVEVSDLTVDSNLAGQSVGHCPTSVGLSGSNNRISRVRAINWGTTVPLYECFPIYLGAHYQPREYHNGLIEDCIVDQPAQVAHADGTTGFGAFTGLEDRTAGAWVIRGCTVKNIASGGAGQPAYFHGYTPAGRGVEIANNFAINLTGNGSAAVYQDTWTGQDVIIRDNSFLNVYFGVYYNFNPPSFSHTNIAVLNNLITVTNGGSGIAFLHTENGHVMRKVRIEGNIIYPHASGGNIKPLGVHGDIEFSADNNVLESGGGDYDFFTGGHYITVIKVLSFRNNHNLRGKPLWMGDWVGDSVFKGYYEEDLTFTPTQAGWHKILLCGGLNSARLNVWSAGTLTDFGLAFGYNDYDPGLGEITMPYNNSRRDFPAPIPRVRLAKYTSLDATETAKYGASWPLRAVELEIASSQVGFPVTIRVSGMLRPPPYLHDFSPYPATLTPTVTRELAIGPGIRTTGPIYSGSTGQQITDANGNIVGTVVTSGSITATSVTANGSVSASSFTGDGSSLTALNASSLSSGTLPDGRLSGIYSQPLTFSNTGNSFAGDGSGLTSLNASSVTSGTLADGRLAGTYSDALTLNNTNNSFTAGSLTIPTGAASGHILRSDASGNASWAPASSLIAMPGAMLNLLITNQASDLNNKVGITADALALSDTNGNPMLLRNVSLTVDIGAAGANGIDETPELTSKWYYIWVVHNGTSAAGLLSTNHLCPKAVSGYPTNCYKTLVGAVFNNGSGNFNDFLQHDRRVWIAQQNVFTGKAINTASTYIALNSTDRGTFQNIVPAIARSFTGTAARATGNSANIINLRLAPEGSSLGHAPMGFSPPAGAPGWLPYEIPIRDPLNRTFNYWVSATGETWTVAVTGYSF